MVNLAIFASGNGSNAQRIIEYFSDSLNVKVSLVLSNNPSAFVLKRADNLGIPNVVFSRNDLYNSETVCDVLQSYNINFIVLAGFLWLVPENILKTYTNRIVNIHPALLPSYGGRGMYGMKVHENVIKNREKESGITIHWVNMYYDEGAVIFQAKCPVVENETPESLASKIHELEYRYYPEVIEGVLRSSQLI